MMILQFISGASLFALLIVDVCCLPLKGSNPGPYYEGYTNAADFNQGAPSGQYSAGAAVLNQAPKDVSTPFYQPAPEEPSFSQPAVQGQPATSVGSSFSAPVSGHRGSSVRENPASSMYPGAAPQHPGTASQPGSSVAPQGFFPGGGEMSYPRVASSRPENVSPPLPPPEPVYQAGEMSKYEQAFEYGDYERETEDQGYQSPPPPPMLMSSQPGYTSPPQPVPGGWGPYPFYNLYPPGTVTHSSSSYEQGHDSWQDNHYVRYYGPYNLAAPQRVKAPRQPVKSAVKH